MKENAAAADLDTAARVLNRLGWCIDRRDWNGVGAVLAENVDLDYSEVFGGSGESLSGADVIQRWRATLTPLKATQHVITGVQASAVEDGIAASANVVAAHVGADGTLWTIGGWYAARIDSGAEPVVTALTLHPSWETGDRGVLAG